jgi:hypothetical protein
VEYYSVITKYEILTFAGKWILLMPSQISQVQKVKYHIFTDCRTKTYSDDCDDDNDNNGT